jgi:DNA-binding GntR family transcriptional regulator
MTREDAAAENQAARGDAAQPEQPEARIYHDMHRAIVERRLSPGLRLVEEQLADVFGVSRARIRSVLQALARDKVVTLRRNGGACVAEPTAKEARDVFAARRMIEAAIMREVVRSADDRAIRKLKAHIRRESQAERSGDRARELRVSHEFHTLLAEATGNDVLIGFMRELMARSALVTAFFERPDVAVCSHVTHAKLIDSLERRDEEALVHEMLAHLAEIESYLVLHEREAPATDLRTIFQIR